MTPPTVPRITFGIIVLNGEPFVRYNLRALYPFAHEIIVVEGAAPAAKNVATPDGHSRDTTLQTLYDFQANEDPAGKVQIVTRDGFWSEKDEMSQAYAERATGDYLWQIDIDEFYLPEHMQAVLDLLHEQPDIAMLSFRQKTFWGHPDVVCDGWYLQRHVDGWHRVFQWGAGYRYVTHRPPTILDAEGRNIRKQRRWLTGAETIQRGWFMYHYSLLFPRQVLEKCEYYENVDWDKFEGFTRWAQQNFLQLKNPFRPHNVYSIPSWLERFEGPHPPQILAMWQDIAAGRLDIETRSMQDVERLLNSRWYPLARAAVQRLERVNLVVHGRGFLYRVRRKVRQLTARGG